MSPILLLLVLGTAASTYLSYQDSVVLGGSCFPRDTCRVYRKHGEDHLWGNYSCECGRHCSCYGTCCIDSRFRGLEPPVTNWKCHNVKSMAASVIMVSECSGRWQYESSDIKELCISKENFRDPLTAVPATSLASGVTYKNYFCSVCNGDSSETLLWSISLETDSKEVLNHPNHEILKRLAFDSETSSWAVYLENEIIPIKISFKIPTFLQKYVKKCYINMIHNCPSAHSDSNLNYKCLSYYAPIKVANSGRPGFTKYRNVHCALCNGANVTIGDEDMCRVDPETSKRKRPFSFALLLDINRSDGELVGMVDPSSKCRKDETYDPFFKKCRTLVCALPGHVIRDGKCVST